MWHQDSWKRLLSAATAVRTSQATLQHMPYWGASPPVAAAVLGGLLVVAVVVASWPVHVEYIFTTSSFVGVIPLC